MPIQGGFQASISKGHDEEPVEKESTLKMADTKGSSSVNSDIHSLHKEWEEASCPICMDHPHNSVLLICSSHEKGCRSYICDTSYRHSNCLDRFKKPKVNMGDAPVENSDGERRRELAESENINNQHPEPDRGGELSFLKCPLCRGNVLGWLIVKEARQYLDLKGRNCSRESCSFSGNYRELRRHARRDHPTTRPADVDPSRQRAWRRLEHQREYGDILSAIRSAMPGAIVLGDYVLDNGGEEEGRSSREGGPWWTTFFLFHMISSPLGSLDEPRWGSGSGSSRGWRTHRRSSTGAHRNLWGENLLGLQDEDDDDDDITIPRRRRRITRTRGPDDEQP